MELKKQDIGVWVKASDGTPDADLHTVTRNQLTNEFSWFCYEDGDTFEEGEEWLKPIEQVYVLTEDELKQLIDLAFTVGGAYDVQKYSGKDMMGLQNKKQFIQSITTIK